MSILSFIKQTILKAGSVKLALSFIFIIAISFNLNQFLDTSSKQHIDKAFNRALITFGISKTLNGVISVAQGTEIAIQPAGIGVNLTPGQILDPVNDLVERFSWIMLLSTTSLGVQKVFLTMSIWPAFTYFLTVFLLFAFVMLFTHSRRYFHFRTFVLRISLLLIILRFTVPLTAMASESMYTIFLENEYVTSTKKLKSTAQQISELNQNTPHNQPDIKQKSVWESAKAFYNSTSEMLDINKKIDAYKQAAADTTNQIINLIVIFLFQTVIIPLGFILVLYVLFKYIIKVTFKV